MIYLDTSVALAHLFAEDRHPPRKLWSEQLASSRLIAYEIFNRLHAKNLGPSHEKAAQALLDRLIFVELTERVLERALQPFPMPIRTLDALHIASLVFLQSLGQKVELATYDERQLQVAELLEIHICDWI